MRTSSYPYLASQTPFPGESGDKKVVTLVEPKKLQRQDYNDGENPG